MNKSKTNLNENIRKNVSDDQPRNFLMISHLVAQRLQKGHVTEEKVKDPNDDDDQNWIKKLSEIDRNHTIEQNLDIVEAQRILNSLSTYTSGNLVTACPVDKRKIIDCYTFMKGDTLKCEPEVQEFINCIDNLLYKATHINERESISFKCPKKMTYRERFESTCLNEKEKL